MKKRNLILSFITIGFMLIAAVLVAFKFNNAPVQASASSERISLVKRYHLKAYVIPGKWRGSWKNSNEVIHIGRRTFYTTYPKQPRSLLRQAKNTRTYRGRWWKYSKMQSKKGSQYILFMLPNRHVQGHLTMGVGGPGAQGQDYFLTRHHGKKAIAALTPAGRNVYYYKR